MNNAIGVIDSGVGGLTVAKEIMKQLPNERIIYVGDTLRCPYGSKSHGEVKKYVLEIVNIIVEMEIKLLVVACNTATAIVLTELTGLLSIPVIGVINPGAKAAMSATVNSKIGIIGTQGTIRSNAYEIALKKIKPSIEVTSLACPLFVPMIEAGKVKGDETERIVRSTLTPIINADIDTLILGCTHYPLIAETIQNVIGTKVSIVSSSVETAKEVKTVLEFNNLYREKADCIKPEIYVTGEPMRFMKAISKIFNKHLNHLNRINLNGTVLDFEEVNI